MQAKMNRWQRRLLQAYAIGAVLLVLFPPFIQDEGLHGRKSLGYGFLFSPPHWNGGSSYRGTVDGLLLLAELAALVLVALATWVLLRDRS